METKYAKLKILKEIIIRQCKIPRAMSAVEIDEDKIQALTIIDNIEYLFTQQETKL